MTPMLRQAISMLQLSTIELRELLQKEFLENPMLEEAEDASARAWSPEADETVSDLPFHAFETLACREAPGLASVVCAPRSLAVGMHESTVWRVTWRKVVDIPQGFLPLGSLLSPEPDYPSGGEGPPDPGTRPPAPAAAAAGAVGAILDRTEADGRRFRRAAYERRGAAAGLQ